MFARVGALRLEGKGFWVRVQRLKSFDFRIRVFLGKGL